MTELVAYLSGEFMPVSEAKLSVYDSRWMYGETMTTTLRTFRHRPFRVDDHVERLFRS